MLAGIFSLRRGKTRPEGLVWRVGRNLSAWDRTQLALKLKPMIAAKAKENLATHTSDGYQGLQNSAKAVNTREEVANIAGVSRDTIAKAEKIMEHGSGKFRRNSIEMLPLTRNQMGDSHENGRKPVLRRGRRVARGWIG